MLSQINQSKARLLPYLILSICTIGIVKLQSKHYYDSINQTPLINHLNEEINQKKAIDRQKVVPSFGFGNLRADLLYLNYIQYLGDKESRNQTGYSLIPDYFETIIQYDPHFTEAYLALATANSLYAGKPEKTVDLMNRVLESISPEIHPEVSYLWTYKGLDELLYLGDTQAARKSYLTAAKWARKRGDKLGEKIAQKNLKTAKFLATNPDTREAQILAWSMILPKIKDEQNRQVIMNKIQALKSELAVANLEDQTN
ncbi:MAG: hypothetical protein AB4206_03110 [Xenococcaceae cyanobacterium]